MTNVEVRTHANEKIVEELAIDYASHINVDLSSETNKIHEVVDDMLIRLEEFESIVGMVQNLRAECTYEYLMRFRSVQPQLTKLCKRIDALEHVVARASIDLNNLEGAVDNAEVELGGYTTVSDRILGIFNPFSLFKSKSPIDISHTSSGASVTPLSRHEHINFDLPPIFRTQDAFESTE